MYVVGIENLPTTTIPGVDEGGGEVVVVEVVEVYCLALFLLKFLLSAR